MSSSAAEGVVEGGRLTGILKFAVLTMCVDTARTPTEAEQPMRTRLVLAAEAEREARRGHVARRRRCEIDVEVVVEPSRARKAVEVDPGAYHEARLGAQR